MFAEDADDDADISIRTLLYKQNNSCDKGSWLYNNVSYYVSHTEIQHEVCVQALW
jgi:hypothetical protein